MNGELSGNAIAVVVVSYNSEETIDECLSRIRAASGVEEVRVVDNNSSDVTMELVQRHALADPRVRFVANPENPGFAVACNQGASGSASPWLAFVNPDCFVEADSLARLRAHASTAGSALVGADLVDEQGMRDTASRRVDPDFAAILRKPSRAELGVTPDAAVTLQQVDAVSGALMLMPRNLFERLGGFDEGYRLHAEDLDLCRRARAAGAIVACANDVSVVHVRGVSSRARPLFVEWHKHRGFWRYYRKFDAASDGLFTRFAVFAMIWGRFPVAVLRAAARQR